MTDSHQQDSDKRDWNNKAKIEKKLAKARLKEAKKRAKGNASTAPVGDGSLASSPTPAERSAAAAEKQVRLQSFRVWFAALGVIIALGTLLITFKPWKTQTANQASPPPITAEPGESVGE